MITELSSGQWGLMVAFRDQMLAAGRVCGQVNRGLAELAVRKVYAERGLVGPSVIVWARSPYEGCIFAQILESSGQISDQLSGQFREELSDNLYGQIGGQISGQIGSQISGQISGQLRNELNSQLGRQLDDHLYGQLADELCNQLFSDQLGGHLRVQLREELSSQLHDQACYGPHDLYWLGFYQFLKCKLGLKSSADPGPQILLAKNCGWWWPFSGLVVLSEHPVSLNLDSEGRLHSSTEMAIKYSDGFGLYRWHGVQVPPPWILSPGSVTPQTALTWPNIEQRRVAAEIVGWHRVLVELGAKTLDVDMDPQIGVLLEVLLPDSGLERFLRVECGTGRTFALPVPPSVSTALEAQCWIHGGVSPSIIRQLEVRT